MTRRTVSLFLAILLVSEASGAPLESKLAGGGTLVLEAQPGGARLLLRPDVGQPVVLRTVAGARPVSLQTADLRGDGLPEQLATFEDDGSGGYRTLLLVAQDGKAVLWESRPLPGAEAKVAGGARSVEITQILRGERPEGDLASLSELTWTGAAPVLRRKAMAEPKNPWQCLTGGLDAMGREDWKDAVTLFTRAVDSKEGGFEALGGEARHFLARALLADDQGARARSMLVGLRKRFPDSSFSREAQRTLDLLDGAYKAGYAPAVGLIRAEEAVKARRFADAERLCQEVLGVRGSTGLADRAHFVLGQAYDGLGRTKQAVKQFQTIVLYFPSSPLERMARDEVTRLELPGKP